MILTIVLKVTLKIDKIRIVLNYKLKRHVLMIRCFIISNVLGYFFEFRALLI